VCGGFSRTISTLAALRDSRHRSSMRIRYPTVPGTMQPVVLTTDFVITLVNGLERIHQARTVKYSDYLSSQRTLEKLEIERRY
jgi:hypothetical protein